MKGGQKIFRPQALVHGRRPFDGFPLLAGKAIMLVLRKHRQENRNVVIPQTKKGAETAGATLSGSGDALLEQPASKGRITLSGANALHGPAQL